MATANKMAEIKIDIEELESLKKQATRRYVSDLLSLEIRKLETQLSKLHDDRINESAAALANNVITEKSDSKRYQIKLNGYGWDQSDKFVKVFVTLKNAQTLASENVYCNLTENSMELNVKDLDNKDYVLVINKLLNHVNVKASYWKQKTDMVVVFLSKSIPGTNWSHMTEIEKRFDENKANKFKTDNMDGKGPQDSLMGLMKNMYESGDDDMKRMIKKAWTEGQDKQASARSMDF
ncbi:calcyclin-binding protein-like [Arctopsyche grandis]|uniref:calcyclin-binding protein-like n=1 Tax=Arctopsyche grandis TaxID=121162 RepID=UPI00406D9CC2